MSETKNSHYVLRNISKCIVDSGKTNGEIARLAVMRAEHVSDFKKKKRPNPTLKSMMQLADALGVDVSEFFK